MESRNKESHNTSSFMQIVLGALIGVLLGIAGVLIYQGYLGQITNILLYVSLVFFGVVVLTFILVWGFKTYLTRLIFGSKVADSPDLIAEAQTIASQLSDGVIDKVMENATAEQSENAKGLVLRLGNWFVWGRLRNWWWSWILGIFVSLGGLTGTLLLVNQNQLIKHQMFLEEASRRGALVMLMSNIFDKVDREIERQRDTMKVVTDSTKFKLSQSLIGQIAALSQAFKPYRFMDGGELIKNPLSPERGQLLITITRLPLDTGTFRSIYQRSTFESADLNEAELSEADLRSAKLKDSRLINAHLDWSNLGDANLWNADLREANLSNASLSNASLSNANLTRAYLREADLKGAHFREANLSRANLSGSDLRGASMWMANLSRAYLWSTDLSKAELWRANLRKAKLDGAKLDGADLWEADLSKVSGLYTAQVARAQILYKCKLPKNINVTKLKKEKPELFKKR